jgi:nucleotide-binding universal stress UspA family protein
MLGVHDTEGDSMELIEPGSPLNSPTPLEARPESAFPTYRRALVPLDGSAVAEAIIPAFTKIARPLRLEVVLLRVLQRIPRSAGEGVSAELAAESVEHSSHDVEQYLSTVAEGLSADGVSVQTVVRLGDPATEIVDGARELEAELIAMTTHGRSGLSRLLFGSVAEAVLRRAHVPVFLMRVTEAEAAEQAA